MIVDLLVNNITGFVSSVGYWGIFLLMALESTMFPLPSELVMPFAGFLAANGAFEFWTVLIASTLGCLAGSLLSYYLGYYGGIPFVRKFGRYFLINEDHLKKSEEWFLKRGDVTIFLGRFITKFSYLEYRSTIVKIFFFINFIILQKEIKRK